MKTNIFPLPMVVGLLIGLVLIIGLLQSGALVSASDHYREIYRMETLGEKKRAMVALSNAERKEVWKLHFNDIRQHFDVTPVQSAIFDQTAEAIGRHDREAAKQLEQEADAAFDDHDLRFAAFGTIGPYKTVGVFCKPTLWQRFTASFSTQASFGNCPCSVGSSFNMSCTDTCGDPAGKCTQTEDGCGFGWMYPCNGNCKTTAD